MSADREEKWVFISGASGDLGKAFALECARRGWNLFLTDVCEPALIRIADGLGKGYDVQVRQLACDLTNPASRGEMLAAAKKMVPGFDCLINVAGLDFEGRFDEQRVEQIETMVRLNVESTLAVTHGMLDLRAAGRRFTIINVVSLAAFYPMPIKATYAASKRFLLDFSLALGEELRSENVQVTALCPAGMPTRQECIDAISAQGVMGQLTTLDVGRVAYQTLEGALKGQKLIIPGRINRWMVAAGNLIPRAVLVRMIYQRWGAVRDQRRVVGTL
jgi:short-subunit dehydrogenase